MKNITFKEWMIIYHLINAHLNSIGENSTYLKSWQGKKGDYLWQMEQLENKVEKQISRSQK